MFSTVRTYVVMFSWPWLSIIFPSTTTSISTLSLRLCWFFMSTALLLRGTNLYSSGRIKMSSSGGLGMSKLDNRTRRKKRGEKNLSVGTDGRSEISRYRTVTQIKAWMWPQILNCCGKTKAIVHKIMIEHRLQYNFLDTQLSSFLLITLAWLLFNFHQVKCETSAQ